MPLETASYISDLVATNPAASDPLSNADDHMRLIKLALKNTFPNFTAAALNSTQAQLDGAAAQYTRNGAAPAGMIADFGGTTAPTGWLICDGQAVSRTTYADLFAAIGTTWGAGDGSTTFNVPPLLGYFRRHRDNSTLAGTVGTKKGPVNLTHTHTGSGNTGFVSNDHTHTYSGTTAAMNQNAAHTHTINGQASLIVSGAGAGVGGGGAFGVAGTPLSNSATNIDHGHAFSGTTSGISANHSHAFSFTTAATGDANEARPYSAAVLTCIKT